MAKSEDKRFKIAHSQYFGKDIMCVKYHSDDDWYFCFVDKELYLHIMISNIYIVRLKGFENNEENYINCMRGCYGLCV